MTWLPDGKICSAHKSCRVRKCTGRWKRGRRVTVSEIQLNTCHLFISNFLLSSFPPSLPFYSFIHSFVLLCSLHRSSSLCFDPPCECGRGLTFSHLLEEKCASLTCLEAAPWRPCADLYVCACELQLHNRLSHHLVWCSAGESRGGGAVSGTWRLLFWLNTFNLTLHRLSQTLIRREWAGEAMINEAKGLPWITIS